MIFQEAREIPRIHHGGASQPTWGKMTDVEILYLETGRHWDTKNGVYYGTSESRKDGQASGY